MSTALAFLPEPAERRRPPVMDYVAGVPLLELMRRLSVSGRTMPVEMACFVAYGVAQALAHAHEQTDDDGRPLQVIHGHVSPANIMIGFDGLVRLIDFGIGRTTLRSHESEHGMRRGKIRYMSPEQIGGHRIDSRADLFALAVVLHEMLTGQRLFVGADDFDILRRIRDAEAPDPRMHRPDIPAPLAELLMRALSRDPDQRPASAAEVRDALRSVMQSDVPRFGMADLSVYVRRAFRREAAESQARIPRWENTTRPRPEPADSTQSGPRAIVARTLDEAPRSPDSINGRSLPASEPPVVAWPGSVFGAGSILERAAMLDRRSEGTRIDTGRVIRERPRMRTADPDRGARGGLLAIYATTFLLALAGIGLGILL